MEMVESKEEWCEEEGDEEEEEESVRRKASKREGKREHLMLPAHNQQRGPRRRASTNLAIYSAG